MLVVGLLLFAAAAVSAPTPGASLPKTVCTITVNSADEQAAFRRHLPPASYRFVELVERGRADWLASVCRSSVRCDLLLISGHFDGGNEFYSDRLDVDEFLPVTELERAACSESCPGLLGGLREVYLFGCNTLNPRPQSEPWPEIVRGPEGEGRSSAAVAWLLQSLNARHGESSRDKMRMIFKDVPAIYGFASTAPLGEAAASTLDRHFRTFGTGVIGTGRSDSRLLGAFAPHVMAVASGVGDSGPLAAARRDMCRLVDERQSTAEKLRFVHRLLNGDDAQLRRSLDRIGWYIATPDAQARRDPAALQAWQAIAGDTAARARLLGLARDAGSGGPDSRARLLNLARELGWLTDAQARQELARLTAGLLDRPAVGVPEVDFACRQTRLPLPGDAGQGAAVGQADDVGHAALLACLGSAEGRARTLQALLSERDADVRIAQRYLRHRPITDAAELRQLAEAITDLDRPRTQVLALDALGRHYLADREILSRLLRLYTQTPSWSVQEAVAGALMRADRGLLAAPAVVDRLRRDRLPAPPDSRRIDALIAHLQRD